MGQFLNFGFENFEMGLRVESFSSGVLDQVGSGIATAVRVDFLTKPPKEGLVVAIFYRGGEGGKVPIRGLPKLGGGQVAERVGGEVAEAAKRPVDILQATAGIVGDF
ncbi:MAG: hypothetical protein ABR82_06715 [Verrucomicrobia subdivision 6 bacterium BACL9 MAG-120507-bin52]|uniref:Uncharacterized protein n=1 Tax=Verrucomicrobia subdivision 6 bacterium BACL9 MAG-120507-bin52 TaxID=1655590 RepID=A0A0R2RH02_9BACT|nr:MAG: hypothetical protein ABR82_06715 [Verrucomicrobia subdivision 6 bacterium BACL9 MAG-120507-bin52]